MPGAAEDDEGESWTCPNVAEETQKWAPSGWPQQLDYGIYWFGPNGQYKKAQPQQRVVKTDPSTWVDHGDGYINGTDRWNNEFYDQGRQTVIFFHGWSGSKAWLPQNCQRATTLQTDTLSGGANASIIDLAAAWVVRGWNVGFFYWDQFANEPCEREAEQKIWFDRRGNGLRWSSYSNVTNSVEWKHYFGKQATVAEMCAEAVKDSLGDFYAGRSVRFVGHASGAQLAANCAAKLHEDQHVAAPQRMTLLEPFFAKREVDYSFFGVGVRCNHITSEEGVENFVEQTTDSYIKQLWVQHEVVTEIYSSKMPSVQGETGLANDHLAMHTVMTILDPQWCNGVAAELHCRERASLLIYFLQMAWMPPPLVPTLPNGQPSEVTKEDITPGICRVPSAGCSDVQIRTLIERRQAASDAASQESNNVRKAIKSNFSTTAMVFSSSVPPQEIWKQVGGSRTLDPSDDYFQLQVMRMGAFVANGDLAAQKLSEDLIGFGHLAPNKTIEAEISDNIILSKRQWGLTRNFKLNTPANGMSLRQLKAGSAGLLLLVSGIFVVFGVYGLAIRFWPKDPLQLCKNPRGKASKVATENDDDEEDVEEGSGSGSGGSSSSSDSDESSGPMESNGSARAFHMSIGE